MKELKELQALEKAKAAVANCIANRRAELAANLADYEKDMLNTQQAVEAATADYLSSGVALYDNAMSLYRIGETPRSYFEGLARELGRPFVWAEKTSYTAHNHKTGQWEPRVEYKLHVPRTQRCQNVVSGLNLVAVEWVKANEDTPVLAEHRANHWSFRFRGEEGAKLFESFLEQCRTDPVMRATLRV